MTMQRAIELDHARGVYLCRVPGPGNAVIETETLDEMKDFLARFRCAIRSVRPSGDVLYVTLERIRHVDSDPQDE